MKKNEIIFAIICGLAVAWIAVDFFAGNGWVFFIILPLLSVLGLLLCDIIGKKYLFIHQAGKFVLTGAFADVIDIKAFQILILIAPFSLFFKGISFLIATAIKYWTNKHWAFEKHEKDGTGREAVQFFLVTLVGLAIDVVSFYYFSRIRTGISAKLWVELSIILAALVAAAWNFLGYKYVVFKK
jgi:putative flippase GtrA